VVADSGNHRIQQLSSTGRPIAAWTRTGTGSIFKQPTGIAVDARGHVYVAGGAVDGKVFELTSEGSPAPGWTVPSDSTGHQYASVAVGPGGRIYVADQLNSVVLVFSSAGQQLPAWSGPVSTPFYGPEGIAFGQSAVYVADTGNDRIVKLSATGKPLAELGGVGVAEGNFVAPAAVAVDTAGNIYAVDKSDDTVQRISPQGQFTAQWAGSGSGNGQLRSPSAIAVDGQGHVYVADTGNNRVEEFSSSGQFVRIWGTRGSRPGQFQFPSGIAVDSTGKVYVADTRNNRIQKFAPPGS
jgi:sugar lactone lactonase YvrE